MALSMLKNVFTFTYLLPPQVMFLCLLIKHGIPGSRKGLVVQSLKLRYFRCSDKHEGTRKITLKGKIAEENHRKIEERQNLSE